MRRPNRGQMFRGLLEPAGLDSLTRAGTRPARVRFFFGNVALTNQKKVSRELTHADDSRQLGPGERAI